MKGKWKWKGKGKGKGVAYDLRDSDAYNGSNIANILVRL